MWLELIDAPLPVLFVLYWLYHKLANQWFMYKHKLLELNKIIEQRIGSLIEEVEIANNARLSPTDLKDEMVPERGSILTMDHNVRVTSSSVSF